VASRYLRSHSLPSFRLCSPGSTPTWGVLDPTEQLRQALLQPLGDLLDIHQRHIPDPALDPAVVGPVQPATFGGLFLIDPLFLADATDGAATNVWNSPD
jgi:hypothetical protein